MIFLIVLAAVLGLWAAIATGIAVAKDIVIAGLDAGNAHLRKRVAELEDRHQSSSLSEFASARVAMQLREPEPDVTYRYDDFGISRDIAPEEPDAE